MPFPVGCLLQGTDPDEDALTYSLVPSEDASKFRIDNAGKLYVTEASLDYETKPRYEFSVQVDDSRLTATAQVTVALTDGECWGVGSYGCTACVTDVGACAANDAPTLHAATLSVPESASVGAAVGTLTASDVDATDSHTFAVQGSNDFFSVDSDGVVRVKQALDFETTPSYAFTAQVTDKGPAVSAATVVVSVQDVNEAPVMEPQVRATARYQPCRPLISTAVSVVLCGRGRRSRV